MGKINVLPKSVYNRISAGEVVERPQSIVKELIENSVDAEAKNITVSIENGGINSITVEDDGCGILSEDIENVFLPHATSKISTAEDLDTIGTLGFRGEAMASIASVSKVKIVSKTSDAELGESLLIEGGDIIERSKQSCETGTKITVSGIFYNTPARLKFLKSARSEESEITTLIEKMILANPSVAFKYYVNSKLVYQSFGDGLKNALIAVYGKSVIDNTIEIATIKNGIKIEGFLGKINFTKATKAYQTLIVNGRWVTDGTVSSAMFNAYSTYLMKRQQAFWVLSLTVPKQVVDVNVHPRKSEVRFQNNQILYSSIYTVASKVIDGSKQALEIIRKVEPDYTPTENIYLAKPDSDQISVTQDFEYDISNAPKDYLGSVDEEQNAPEIKKYINEQGKIAYKPYEIINYKKDNFAEFSDHIRQQECDFTNPEYVKSVELDNIFLENKRYIEEQEKLNSEQQNIEVDLDLNFIGQVFDTYLIFSRGNEMYFVDQHAAHERILYDQFLEKAKNKKVIKEQLLIPYLITLNAKEFDIVYELMDYMQEIGIDIGISTDNSFKIYSIPLDLPDTNIERFIHDIINDESLREEKVPMVIREKLIQKACKSAIKAGDKLSQTEIEKLMEYIKCDLGLKCPHGRPIVVKITRTEVDKWFKRIL